LHMINYYIVNEHSDVSIATLYGLWFLSRANNSR
jgi:hypothetical protein